METLLSRFGTFCATTAIYPQDDWSLVASSTVTGLVVVFLILTILVLILLLMGKVLNYKGKKSAKEVASVKVPLVQPQSVADEEDDFIMVSDDEEVIAAITAAITAYGAAEHKEYAIKGIRKKEFNGISSWRAAGMQNNTQKF